MFVQHSVRAHPPSASELGGKVLMPACGFASSEDPNETKDLAKTMPDVLHSLKTRYLELRKTAYDQVTPIAKAYTQPFMTQMNERYSAALKRYGGFQGPFWGLDDEEEK